MHWAGHTWCGTPLGSAGVSCALCVTSQPLVHPQAPHQWGRVGGRNSLMLRPVKHWSTVKIQHHKSFYEENSLNPKPNQPISLLRLNFTPNSSLSSPKGSTGAWRMGIAASSMCIFSDAPSSSPCSPVHCRVPLTGDGPSWTPSVWTFPHQICLQNALKCMRGILPKLLVVIKRCRKYFETFLFVYNLYFVTAMQAAGLW